MSPHIGDELAALLAGELSPADTAAVLRHAQTCPQCLWPLIPGAHHGQSDGTTG